MNTRAIGAASEVIFRALSREGVVPATIAVALDANGLLAGPDAAAETLALRAHIAELQTQLEIAERRNRELTQDAQCPSVARTFGSQCALPVRHRGDHCNAARNHYWDDVHAVPSAPAVAS